MWRSAPPGCWWWTTGGGAPTPMGASCALRWRRWATPWRRWPTLLVRRTRASRPCCCAGSRATSQRRTARARLRSGARGRTTCFASGVEAQAVRHRGGLGAAAHAQLGEDARHVHARGLLGHVERVADLAVGPALGHERENLALARGEPERLLLGGLEQLLLAVGGSLQAFELQASAGAQPLDLAPEPARAEPARGVERQARRYRGGLTVA